MTVRAAEGTIRLEGACRVEEAEALTGMLQAELRPVDLSLCREAHSAVLQVLLAFAPPIVGEPADNTLRALLRSTASRTNPVQAIDNSGVARVKMDNSPTGDVKNLRRS